MGYSKNRNDIKAVLKKAIVRWHLVQLMQILQNEMPRSDELADGSEASTK